jgi:hypothetical protein
MIFLANDAKESDIGRLSTRLINAFLRRFRLPGNGVSTPASPLPSFVPASFLASARACQKNDASIRDSKI